MMTSLITMLAAVSSQHGVTARSRIGLPAIVVGREGSRMTARPEPPAVVDLQLPKTCRALEPVS